MLFNTPELPRWHSVLLPMPLCTFQDGHAPDRPKADGSKVDEDSILFKRLIFVSFILFVICTVLLLIALLVERCSMEELPLRNIVDVQATKHKC
jgi:hypothetical protein